MSAMIDTRNLVKEYVMGEHRVYALRNVSIAIQEGEFVRARLKIRDLCGRSAERLVGGNVNAVGRALEEKAVSNFLNLETFTDWRRTGYPAITLVQNAVTNSIPRRLLYPQSEKINNPQPQQSALLTEKVWWEN